MELKTSADIKTMHITRYAIDFAGPMRFLNILYSIVKTFEFSLNVYTEFRMRSHGLTNNVFFC